MEGGSRVSAAVQLHKSHKLALAAEGKGVHFWGSCLAAAPQGAAMVRGCLNNKAALSRAWGLTGVTPGVLLLGLAWLYDLLVSRQVTGEVGC